MRHLLGRWLIISAAVPFGDATAGVTWSCGGTCSLWNYLESHHWDVTYYDCGGC